TNRLDQKTQPSLGVEHGVVIELAHPIQEALATSMHDAARLEAADLVGNRSAAVRNDDLQLRKVREDLRIDEPEYRDCFLVDEIHGVGRTRRVRACGVNVCRHVEPAE